MVVVRPRGNVPKAVLRWTIERASGEFKLATGTLRKMLNQGGAEPDKTGCYTTQQICQCLYGDLHHERVRKERQLTRKYSLENAMVEASVLNRAEIAKGLAAVADAMTSRIMSANVDRAVKEDLLKDLANCPLILDDVAARQTKLSRGNGRTNGNGEED